jgi:hypothetical protein
MLERLDFQQLLESTITSKRVTRVMSLYKFCLGLVLGFYVGLQRLNQMRFIARDPILTGILGVERLPAAIHIVALSGGFAPERSGADSQDSAGISATRLGSRKRETGDRDAGHGHDRAHGVWEADGCAQELQPEEQRQAQLPADLDVYGGNTGVPPWRSAQWGSAQWARRSPVISKR